MLEITTQPSAYNFAGNIPDFIVSSDEEVSFKLYKGLGPGIGSGSGSGSGTGGIPGEDDLLLDETYTPDSDDILKIELREYIEKLLSIDLPGPTVELYDQTKAYCQLTAHIGSGAALEEITFYVIKGGVDSISNDAAFLQANFLTWQEQVKCVKMEDPEWISYFAQEEAVVWATAYFSEGENETISLHNLAADTLYSINTKFSLLSDKFDGDPVKIDIWVSDSDSGSGSGGGIPGPTLSKTQAYQLFDEPLDYDDLFVFANSVGGIDCIRFTGLLRRTENFVLDKAKFDRDKIEFHSEPDRTYSKNTGDFRSRRHLLWSRDFFASILKYRWAFGNFHRIVTDRTDLDSVLFSLSSYDFSFQESRQTLYQDYYELFGPPVPPEAPSSLTATATSQTEIGLTWNDNSGNETGFTIERDADPGFSSPTEILKSANATSHADTGLDSSTTYYYRIKATGPDGDSTWSATASATTLAYFVATYKTDNAGSSGSSTTDSVKLPLMPGGTYNFSMYNDDTDALIATVTEYSQHQVTFPSVGTFKVRFEGTIEGWQHNSGFDPLKLLEVHSFGQLSFGGSIAQFYGCSNLVISATDSPDLSETTSLRSCFRNLSSFNSDIGHWDVSTIIDFEDCFKGCSSFNQSLSNWDMASAIDIQGMLEDCSSYNQEIDWDTPVLEACSDLLNGCTSFNSPISLDTSSVILMNNMFYGCTLFNQDISGWDTSSVTDMSFMFQDAIAFNQDIGSWNVSNVTTFQSMFHGASAFNQDISGWVVTSATSMPDMFRDAVAFNQPIGTWNVASCTNFNGTFYGASAFNQSLSNWNMANAVALASMFQDAVVFNQDMPNWDLTSATDITGMFFGATAFNGDLSNWTLGSGITLLTSLFEDSAFNQDIGSWDVSSVTWLRNTFKNTPFDQDISSWDVSSVTDAVEMLNGGGLSKSNYNNILEAWSQLTLQSSVTIDFGSSEYDFGVPAVSKADIIATYSWTITDGGEHTWEDEAATGWAYWTAQGTRANNFNFSSGDLAERWKDQNANAIHLDQNTVSQQLTLYETGANSINDNPGVSSQAYVDFLESGSVLDGEFFTDQSTDYTLLIAFKHTLGGSSFPRLLENVASTTDDGFNLFLNELLSKVYFSVYNASVSDSKPGVSFKPGSLNVFVLRYKIGVGFTFDVKNVDETATITATDFTANSNNPNYGIIVRPNGAGGYASIGEIVTFKEYKSDEWILNALTDRYNYYKP